MWGRTRWCVSFHLPVFFGIFCCPLLPPGDASDALVKDMVTFLQDRVASWGLNDCHGNAWEEQKSKTAWWVRGDVILWFFVGLEVLYLLHNFFFWFGLQAISQALAPRRVAKTSPRGFSWWEAAPQLERTQALQFLAPKLANLAQSLSAEIRWVKPRGVHSLFHLLGGLELFGFFVWGCCLWLMVVWDFANCQNLDHHSTKKPTRGGLSC